MELAARHWPDGAVGKIAAILLLVFLIGMFAWGMWRTRRSRR
ncbi:hypothetical protein K388_03925 [Streptomyces sp. KhCrAH-43]|nr:MULTISPECIES: hypothetical protein [unclassified Streptomyces]RAJ57866.1 hypothetical protein K388_03925 [Streptomyces sp. KhCrAH-43]